MFLNPSIAVETTLDWPAIDRRFKKPNSSNIAVKDWTRIVWLHRLVHWCPMNRGFKGKWTKMAKPLGFALFIYLNLCALSLSALSWLTEVQAETGGQMSGCHFLCMYGVQLLENLSCCFLCSVACATVYQILRAYLCTEARWFCQSQGSTYPPFFEKHAMGCSGVLNHEPCSMGGSLLINLTWWWRTATLRAWDYSSFAYIWMCDASYKNHVSLNDLAGREPS